MDMIDPVIMETCSDQEQALRCIHVGLLCTQASSSLRPSMSTVNFMLSTQSMMLPDPTAPQFFVNSVAVVKAGTNNSGSSHHQGSSSTSSHTLLPPTNADASITVLEPR